MLVFFLFFVWELFFEPLEAFSLQIHPSPEGIYVHLISHFYFLSSLLVILYWFNRYLSLPDLAWRYLCLSFAFFILWNIDTTIVRLDNTAYTEKNYGCVLQGEAGRSRWV